MLNSPVSRAPTAALLALPVAYGLFLLMSSLIDVKEVTLVKAPSRILDTITPQLPDSIDEIRKRPKPQPLDDAIKPPPPPQISTTKSVIDLPEIQIAGAIPTSLPTHVKMPTINPVVVSSRGYQVVRPPMPVYPSRASARGISGSCNVAFAIDPRGKPYKVSAMCTDPVFKSEAERSVLKAEFAPQLVDGQFVSVTGLEYPLEFKLAE
ncbi:TonB family protein [Hyphomonas sp.]|uniref:TonB family protein n=1 Tax=Hyphomonas sp. TaxID=87 RepID=UPI0030F7017D